MRRVLVIFAALALSLNGAPAAHAQDNPLAASNPVAQSAVAQDPKAEQASHKISEMLTRKFGVARQKAETIATAVMSSASKYSLPPALLLAIISIESRFKETARGPNNATGLMQVVPSAHKKLVRNVDLTDPEDNIETGSAILHGYVKSAQGDVDAALKSYGGSRAYAEKVSVRAKAFEPAASVDAASASAQ
ncbi:MULTISPECIES: transglycosylase SLT domain-containing protein [Caballeronia]|jgi:soluble lytic murein transglycosylase-like protein|uniref:Lytic transglycosylase n=1 Tax=Caballeronia zhejiangensis TaxID=871203 RepID=A0A656QHB3_9BURK|nr:MULTISPECIES: transglycosylase SLT domain-containing protein [Caballeronia]EKS67381.1 lytic transglycosylase [Burkholderia sp. SJ98]KDR29389.1 lytic transglycosylase [Caballeronia zhejiangensis]MCG7404200.1 lytic transglycosylase domain-containing protein [Caballeronia zhejiangensis]MCI1047109.1 transglycosylase SLT domain-containing protein [Caballeronia zhejiangensis]MDR5789335.1 transglycosylase SLT domain-containing protein [Caballeronia sp. LP003]